MAIDFEHECFFIAPIGDPDTDVRKRSDGVRDWVVKPAAAAHGLETQRADDFGEPGQITSQAVQHCLKAKAAVADLTGGNPNVYYELSIRHGAQLPVVLMAATGTKLPFDISQSRVIFFDHTDLNSAGNAREELRAQIEASLVGTPDNPIADGMRLAELMHGSGEEKALVLVMERLERLAATTAGIDDRLRKAERREEILKVIRNQRAHRSGEPYFDMTMQNFLEFYAHQRREEEIKEAEEAGLSPGAYMDDEIISEEEIKGDEPETHGDGGKES